MPFPPASNLRTRRLDPAVSGPLWIAIGMLWLGVAQISSGLPIATAVAVIGYGAMEHWSRKKCRLLRTHAAPNCMVLLLHLLVYVTLVGLAIAAQWDLALRSPAGRLGPLLGLDHLLAMLCLFRLIGQIRKEL